MGEKKKQGGTGANQFKEQRAQNGLSAKTYSRLADEYGVGNNTIKRDADFATALDAMDEAEKNEVLSGKSDLTKGIIQKVGSAVKKAEKEAVLLTVEELEQVKKDAAKKALEEEKQKKIEKSKKRQQKKLESKQLKCEEIDEVRCIPYDENIFRPSPSKSDNRFGDKVFSLKDDFYYSNTTMERFFHRETGLEFSLREYAFVQTFPNDYKLQNYRGFIRL